VDQAEDDWGWLSYVVDCSLEEEAAASGGVGDMCVVEEGNVPLVVFVAVEVAWVGSDWTYGSRTGACSNGEGE
jgi:hypothetical protein